LVAVEAGYPSGTRLVFDQDSPPTGWTRDVTASLDDRLLRIVVGIRADGGSWTLSGLSGSSHSHSYSDVIEHTHTASGASHNHKVEGNETLTGYAWGRLKNVSGTALVTSSNSYTATLADSGVATPSTGSATYGVSSDGSWRPLYRDSIIAEKD